MTTSTGVAHRFRAAWDGMTPLRREMVTLRCQGHTSKEIGRQTHRAANSVKNLLVAAFADLEDAVLAEEGVAPVANLDMICYRLGYERALADVERLAGRKGGAGQ